MANDTKKVVLAKTKPKKRAKRYRSRDTTLIRIDRGLKEAVKAESKRTHETMSKITDWALEEYLESVRSLD